MKRRTRDTVLSLDADILDLAERVAKMRGVTVAALVSRAIRNEALRLGAPLQPTGDDQDALYDEVERAAKEEA
ncbi:MAG: hypothetical protein J2P15_01010 [Micromonosporaceae bacterium]|nr:hypothetical protein [Micromonosporaceae bacterium]